MKKLEFISAFGHHGNKMNQKSINAIVMWAHPDIAWIMLRIACVSRLLFPLLKTLLVMIAVQSSTQIRIHNAKHLNNAW